MDAATLREFAEKLTAPEGYEWAVTTYSKYCKATQDATPTFFAEFGHDGDVEMIYLVGQRQLVPEGPA